MLVEIRPNVDTKFFTSRSLESLRVKGRGPVGLNENIRIYKYLGAFVTLASRVGDFGECLQRIARTKKPLNKGIRIPKVFGLQTEAINMNSISFWRPVNQNM